MDNWKRQYQLGNHRAALLALLAELRPRQDAVQARFLSSQLVSLACQPELPAGALDRRLRSRILQTARLTADERDRLRGAPLVPPGGEVGAVTCALVTSQAPYEALVRRLQISRTAQQQDETCFPSSFAPTLCCALLDACKVMQDHLQRRWFLVPLQIEARHRFQLDQGPAVAAAGRSLGGAAALAFFSLWTGVEVPGTVAVIAALEPGPDGKGRLCETDEVALVKKVEALAQERPHLRRVIVPRSQLRCVPPRLRWRLAPADTLEELLLVALGPDHERRIRVPAGINLYNEVNRAEADYRSGHDRRSWALKARRFEVLAAALPADEANARFRCRCLAFQASCLLHLGETATAAPLLDEARALFDRFEVTADGSFLPWVLDRLAMGQLDVYDLDRARATANEAMEKAERCQLNLEVLAKLHGTLGQILLAQGELDGAVAELQIALDGIHRTRLDECVRNHTYLVRAHGAAGDDDRAHAEFHEAEEHLVNVPEDNRLTHAAYLGYAMADVLLRQGRAPKAADLLLRLPLSTLGSLGPIVARIHKVLVRALLSLGQEDEARQHHRAVVALVGEAPSSRLRWLQATADLELAAGLLEQATVDVADQRQGVEQALRCVPPFPGARDRFGRVAATIRELLEGQDRPALCRAIRQLLDLELY